MCSVYGRNLFFQIFIFIYFLLIEVFELFFQS